MDPAQPTNLPELLARMKEVTTSDPDAFEQANALFEYYTQNRDAFIANTPPEALGAIVLEQETQQLEYEDATREAVLQLAPRYWPDVERRIAESLPVLWFQAFATACAERLLSRHLSLPSEEHRPFTVTCRAPLDCLWGILLEDERAPDLRAEATAWLKEYREGPLNHELGQDGPGDADHSPAAAVIYAVECVLEDSESSARSAMGRVIDCGSEQASKELNHSSIGADEYVEECAHPLFQRELAWLEETADFLAQGYRDIAALRARSNH